MRTEKRLNDIKLEIFSNIIEETYKSRENAWSDFSMRQLNQFLGLADRYNGMWFRDIGLNQECSPFERIYVGCPYEGFVIAISEGFKQINFCFYDPKRSIKDLYGKYQETMGMSVGDFDEKSFFEEIDEVFSNLTETDLGFQYAYFIGNTGGIYTTNEMDVVAGFRKLTIK